MKSERSLNHCDLFRRSYLHCKVRESDGRDVNSALKNNIEGIIIKWTHQVFVNCAQCVLVFFLPSTRHSRWIRCCFRNLCHCICLLQSENCRWMRCYPRSQNKISLSATTQAQWPRSISGRQSMSSCTWYQTSPGTLLNNLPAAPVKKHQNISTIRKGLLSQIYVVSIWQKHGVLDCGRITNTIIISIITIASDAETWSPCLSRWRQPPQSTWPPSSTWPTAPTIPASGLPNHLDKEPADRLQDQVDVPQRGRFHERGSGHLDAFETLGLPLSGFWQPWLSGFWLLWNIDQRTVALVMKVNIYWMTYHHFDQSVSVASQCFHNNLDDVFPS